MIFRVSVGVRFCSRMCEPRCRTTQSSHPAGERSRRARSSRLGLCSNCDFYSFRSLAELSIVINWFQIELDCLTDVFPAILGE